MDRASAEALPRARFGASRRGLEVGDRGATDGEDYASGACGAGIRSHGAPLAPAGLPGLGVEVEVEGVGAVFGCVVELDREQIGALVEKIVAAFELVEAIVEFFVWTERCNIG